MPKETEENSATEQAAKLQQAAEELINKHKASGFSGSELLNFLMALGDLAMRVGVLEGRADMFQERAEALHEAIEKSNDLHDASRQSIDRMNELLTEVKGMLEVYNKAKSTISVIGWFTASIRGIALFLGALAILWVVYKTGSIESLAPAPKEPTTQQRK